ncbi:MAG: serine kinase [Clostridiales bacterium]|nr:MAG: serine kinase [Clostridiales bacterium]
MKVFYIRLSTIEQVRNFVNIVSKYDYEIDLKSGRYVVDAKSIMGIFSLDLLNKIEVTVHAENCDELMKELAPMIVD